MVSTSWAWTITQSENVKNNQHAEGEAGWQVQLGCAWDSDSASGQQEVFWLRAEGPHIPQHDHRQLRVHQVQRDVERWTEILNKCQIILCYFFRHKSSTPNQKYFNVFLLQWRSWYAKISRWVLISLTRESFRSIDSQGMRGVLLCGLETIIRIQILSTSRMMRKLKSL